MPHRAVAIANEFLRQPGATETLTQMQLQKLTYFAHGWNWAISNEPLISDPVEAWNFGPVYRDLYNHTKYFGKEPIGRQITPADSQAAWFFLLSGEKKAEPYVANLNERERSVVSNIWRRYGHLNGIQLSELTHQRGTPWFNTFTKGPRDQPIDEAQIRAHYAELAQRARAAAPAAS